jgi:hypothetical protein
MLGRVVSENDGVGGGGEVECVVYACGRGVCEGVWNAGHQHYAHRRVGDDCDSNVYVTAGFYIFIITAGWCVWCTCVLC